MILLILNHEKGKKKWLALIYMQEIVYKVWSMHRFFLWRFLRLFLFLWTLLRLLLVLFLLVHFVLFMFAIRTSWCNILNIYWLWGFLFFLLLFFFRLLFMTQTEKFIKWFVMLFNRFLFIHIFHFIFSLFYSLLWNLFLSSSCFSFRNDLFIFTLYWILRFSF